MCFIFRYTTQSIHTVNNSCVVRDDDLRSIIYNIRRLTAKRRRYRYYIINVVKIIYIDL